MNAPQTHQTHQQTTMNTQVFLFMLVLFWDSLKLTHNLMESRFTAAVLVLMLLVFRKEKKSSQEAEEDPEVYDHEEDSCTKICYGNYHFMRASINIKSTVNKAKKSRLKNEINN
jgi:hypothetical protein